MIIGIGTVDVSALDNPGSAVPFIDANMTGIGGASVVQPCAHGYGIGVGHAYRPACIVIGGFSYKVRSFLRPHSSVPGIDAYVTGIATVVVIAIGADGYGAGIGHA